MMYVVVGLLLLTALNSVGFRPPGSQSFKLKNAACAAFLTLAYCPSMQEFWRAFKYPDQFAEPTHIFNNPFPNTVYAIKLILACIGTLAVFIGFSLAHRKLKGVRNFYVLTPYLIASSTAKVILSFYRERTEVSILDFAFVLTFALCIYATLILTMRRFYKRNEHLFVEKWEL